MTNTYIVVEISTRKAVLEFFTEKLKAHINTDKYKVLTAREYLPTLNKD